MYLTVSLYVCGDIRLTVYYNGHVSAQSWHYGQNKVATSGIDNSFLRAYPGEWVEVPEDRVSWRDGQQVATGAGQGQTLNTCFVTSQGGHHFSRIWEEQLI